MSSQDISRMFFGKPLDAATVTQAARAIDEMRLRQILKRSTPAPFKNITKPLPSLRSLIPLIEIFNLPADGI